MTPETDLATLLHRMTPTLQPECYVFCTFSPETLPAEVQPLLSFQEAEGTTWIIPKAEAEKSGVPSAFECAHITLAVNSDLNAVGFLATVTAALAEAGIACNVVSAWHHDHLFVPWGQRHNAMDVLTRLQTG